MCDEQFLVPSKFLCCITAKISNPFHLTSTFVLYETEEIREYLENGSAQQVRVKYEL